MRMYLQREVKALHEKKQVWAPGAGAGVGTRCGVQVGQGAQVGNVCQPYVQCIRAMGAHALRTCVCHRACWPRLLEHMSPTPHG